MAALTPDQLALMREILLQTRLVPPTLPSEPEFRVLHADQRASIDELLRLDLLRNPTGHYLPTLAGLRACGTDDAREIIRRCNRLVEALKEKVRQQPRKTEWTPAEIAAGSSLDEDEAKVLLTLVVNSPEQRFSGGWAGSGDGFASRVSVRLDDVLDAQPVPEVEPPELDVPARPALVHRLYIHNFRTFVNFEWSPPAACALVGANGAGKSALIDALWLLQEVLVDGRSIDETSVGSALSPGEDTVLEIDLRGEGDGEGGALRYRLAVHSASGRSAIREELTAANEVLYRSESGRVELFGDRPTSTARTTIPFDRRRSFIASLEPRGDNRRLIAFREAIASIWAMKPDALRIVGSTAGESRFLARDLSNFASWYLARSAEDPDAAAALRTELKGVVTGFATMRFVPISPEVKDLRVGFEFGASSYELPWVKLSDGQRLLIALYGLLRLGLAGATLVALDEPDNYVAPSEIQPWLRAVADSVAERKQQLIVVSHHPESINYMATDALYRMWREPSSGHTRIAPLSPDAEAGETAYDAAKHGSADLAEAGPHD